MKKYYKVKYEEIKNLREKVGRYNYEEINKNSFCVYKNDMYDDSVYYINHKLKRYFEINEEDSIDSNLFALRTNKNNCLAIVTAENRNIYNWNIIEDVISYDLSNIILKSKSTPNLHISIKLNGVIEEYLELIQYCKNQSFFEKDLILGYFKGEEKWELTVKLKEILFEDNEIIYKFVEELTFN